MIMAMGGVLFLPYLAEEGVGVEEWSLMICTLV